MREKQIAALVESGGGKRDRRKPNALVRPRSIRIWNLQKRDISKDERGAVVLLKSVADSWVEKEEKLDSLV